MSNRKLASVQRVWKVEPIEGADRIELVHVLGWQCVATKGQFKPMELCLYFEIDSFLPLDERFEFLRASSYRKTDIMGEGFRLRTMKFKGQLSQGLVMPVTDFPEIGYPKIGMDVSEVLGVKKWEIEEMATTGGTVKGTLPQYVPHTDETRVQAEPSLIDEFACRSYYISTKMDGSSHSLSVDEDGFHVTGHNYEYKDDGKCAFYEFVKTRGYPEAMLNYASDLFLNSLTVQGEFCAPGIQQNRLRLTRPEWYVFTVIINGKRLGLNEMLQFCSLLGMETVPIEEVGENLPEKYPTVEALLERADGNYPNGGKKEGIVIRPIDPVYSPTVSGPLSMKVVSNKYLLKNE